MVDSAPVRQIIGGSRRQCGKDKRTIPVPSLQHVREMCLPERIGSSYLIRCARRSDGSGRRQRFRQHSYRSDLVVPEYSSAIR